MKYTERFFKFPIRLYLTKDVQERYELEEKLNIELSSDDDDLDYVIGWEHVDPDEIFGYGSVFSRNRTLEEVKEKGFDCTIVYLRNGKEIASSWSPKKFAEKLDSFYEQYEDFLRKEMQDRIEEMVDPPKRKNFFQRLFNL